MQNWDRGLDNCSNPSVVKKLDISGVLGGSGSQIQYRTEMLEAACVAIVRIEQLDGQASGALELLAEALDDTIVVWNQVCVCVFWGGAWDRQYYCTMETSSQSPPSPCSVHVVMA